jgi:hypothetical protein
MKLYNVYCDYDGVLVDFIAGMVQIYGKEYYPPYMPDPVWKASKEYQTLCEKTDVNWWENLPPMSDFHDLWNFLKPHRPKVLTAYALWSPEGTNRSIEGKRLWNEKWTKVSDYEMHIVHKDAKMLFAMTYDGNPNILIDDNKQNIEAWDRNGGIAIHHSSAQKTIERLKELGYGTKLQSNNS